MNGGRFAPNQDRTENMYCWEYPVCESCYNQNLDYQGIYWMHARRKYKLSDCDLHCCKFKKYGRTYLLHSNVVEIAKNKYGDISNISQLSSLDIAAINSQRKRCYNKKCKELKKNLKIWLKQTYLTQNEENEHEHNDDDDEDVDIDIEKKIEKWEDIELNESELKSELNEFLKQHHSGYEWFDGAHCQPTVDNFNRKYMHLIVEMEVIQNKLKAHINVTKQRRFKIKNMSKKEMYSDIYKSSWMDNRFGGGYGDYI